MEYQGLSTDDVVNARALNRAWLRLAADGAERFAVLDEARRTRLADAPFLLFSLRETETSLWSELLADKPQHDLFADGSPADRREFQLACLAWLWALARRNPYAARVIAGAPLQWCERIAACPLVRLLRNAAETDLLRPRFPADSPTHRRLLQRGGSGRPAMRSAAHVAAMQAMLTAAEFAKYGRLPAAACRLKPPSRRVADRV